MMIHVFVKYCMVLNSTLCQVHEIAPPDHAVVSQIECIRGVMMGSAAEFTYQGIRWQTRGGTCEEVHSPFVSQYLKGKVSP